MELTAEFAAANAERQCVSLCIASESAFHAGVFFSYSPLLFLYDCGRLSLDV